MNEESTTLNKTADLFPEESLKEVVDAGVFYGRKKSKVNPKMRPYILANRGGIEIINLYKTLESINKVVEFVRTKSSEGGFPLLAGTQPAAMGVLELAQDFGFPVVSNRWLGGTLTNFKVIRGRVEYFKKLRSDLEAKAFDKYTKKERITIEGEARRLTELVGGLENLIRLPDFLVVIDPTVHATAIREARRMKIPIVAFANVDADPDSLDYFVVGNSKAKKSVDWFLGKIRSAIKEGKDLATLSPVVKPAEAAPEVVLSANENPAE